MDEHNDRCAHTFRGCALLSSRYQIINRNIVTSRLRIILDNVARALQWRTVKSSVMGAFAAKILDVTPARLAPDSGGLLQNVEPECIYYANSDNSSFLCACRQESQLSPLGDTTETLIEKSTCSARNDLNESRTAMKKRQRSNMRYRCAKIRAWNFPVSVQR